VALLAVGAMEMQVVLPPRTATGVVVQDENEMSKAARGAGLDPEGAAGEARPADGLATGLPGWRHGQDAHLHRPQALNEEVGGESAPVDFGGKTFGGELDALACQRGSQQLVAEAVGLHGPLDEVAGPGRVRHGGKLYLACEVRYLHL